MTRFARIAALAAVVAAAAAPGAGASGFGAHVSACAQEHLGPRESPPAVTCTHDGMTMTFATFGEMVLHMRQHHG